MSVDQIYEITKNAIIDGGMYAATCGLMKLIPGITSAEALTITRKIANEAGELTINTGVAAAGEYAKTGKVTPEGTATNMLITIIASVGLRTGGKLLSRIKLGKNQPLAEVNADTAGIETTGKPRINPFEVNKTNFASKTVEIEYN